MVIKRQKQEKLGLFKLAQVIRQARGERSYREFEKLTGISHTNLQRLEQVKVQAPEDQTFKALAPHTPYTWEELKAISEDDFEVFTSAEQLWPHVCQLPHEEVAKLAQMIVERLAHPSRSDQDFQQIISTLRRDQLTAALKTIAERLTEES